MIIEKPKLLSIHPTMQCDYHCYNCYLKAGMDNVKEKDPKFFIELVDVAKKIGMTDIAIPLNYVAKPDGFKLLDDPTPIWETTDRNIYYYKWIKERSLKNGLDFSVTCNHDFVTNYRDHVDFEGIQLMTISINDFVTPKMEDKLSAIETMRSMKGIVKEINCNILISPNMVKLLNEGLAEKILEVANTIYLLSSQPLHVPLQNIYDMIGKLDKRLMNMLSDKIHIDSCIRREMGLTGGLCSKHDFIYVNPYGEIKQCSYDQRNLSILEKPDDLEYIYNTKYPPEPLGTCDLVNGQYAQDKKKQMNNARVLSSL
jgi:hypothetical protein